MLERTSSIVLAKLLPTNGWWLETYYANSFSYFASLKNKSFQQLNPKLNTNWYDKNTIGNYIYFSAHSDAIPYSCAKGIWNHHMKWHSHCIEQYKSKKRKENHKYTTSIAHLYFAHSQSFLGAEKPFIIGASRTIIQNLSATNKETEAKSILQSLQSNAFA